jgi:DNA-binding SARP family transcriptional activator
MAPLPGHGADPREPLVIRLFGPLSVEHGARRLGPRDFGGVRPKQVLEILLAARGHHVPVERLAELVWGEERPRDIAGSLQTFVSTLRRKLSSDRDWARALVVTESEAYRFAVEHVELDLDRFDVLLERSAGEPTHRARAALEQALDLVRGEVIEDEPYATWALDLRGSYQGRVLGAHLDAADAALAELDFGPALTHAEAAATLDRFSERARRYEMLALYALGRQHEALSRYRSFRLQLDEELGLEPTPETRALEAAVIRHEDVHSLLPRPIRPARAGAGGHPLRLLGRAEELATLTEGIRLGLAGNLALIAIVGDAGLGKSRLLDELGGELAGVRCGRARCSELEQHLPYVPLAAALREALAGIELDVGRLPALGQVLPELTLGAPRQEFEDVEVLEALVAVIAEHAPLVLLLDDLQWADPHTVAALGYLRRRGVGVPGAIVAAARTVEAQPDSSLRRLAPDALVRLEPLSAAELRPIGRPELHDSTGGNPRFVVEALARGGPSGPSQSLSEALLSQCRAEGPFGYRVLVAASVFEQPFEPEPLADLLGIDATELTEELERLCEQRILRVDGLRFRFRYEVVGQVLLASISPARRRLLQQRLGGPVAASVAAATGRTMGSRAG